jgi:hypothetical protein
VSDRIVLTIAADDATAGAIRAHEEFVMAETLAVDLQLSPADTVTVTVRAFAAPE